ncbi:MAG: hypothetical protein IJX91_01190 [Clostridia bacterium]|nr:hypothetical protein [Clostridia bacterium]
MEKEEENVYGGFGGTEQGKKEVGDGAKAYGASDGEKGSAVPRKFKDVDALARAYSSLQAEFTRRSQRLRELEKQMENPETGKEKKKDEATASAAEKLRKTAEAARAEGREFDRFVSELEQANVRAETAEETLPEEGPESGKPDGIVAAEAEEKNGMHFEEQTEGGNGEKPFSAGDSTSVATSRERETIPTEELYQRASRDESVRLRIIGEYLASVGKAGAPLTKGGGNTPLTPPIKAKTIEDAGNMALRWFKKRAE